MTPRAGALRDGLLLAAGTLTAVPVPPPTRVDRAVARVAMLAAPLVVLPVAAVVAAVGGGLVVIGVPPLAAAIVVVALMALGTRAIHLDGLADTCDGFGVAGARERSLEVMKSGDVGPMGAAALVLSLGLQAAAAAGALSRPWGWVAVCVALAAARSALALGTRRGVPAARPGGLGQAVAGTVPTWAAAVSWIIAAAALTGAVLLGGGFWWGAPATTVLACGAVLGVLALARHRFGGITGDVLGAVVEVAACVLLLGVGGG